MVRFGSYFTQKQDYNNTDFIVGIDSFENLQIDKTENKTGFCFFKNIEKGLVKRFILKRTGQTDRVCVITLIKKGERFTPRFEFLICNNSERTGEKYAKSEIDDIPIKARVNLNECHKELNELLSYIKTIEGVDFEAQKYAVIDSEKKELYEGVSKGEAVSSFVKKFGDNISEKDISLLQNRRVKLDYFRRLLEDTAFFELEKDRLSKTDEGLWQLFFEENQWIFGYGLQLVSCEGLDDSKLETTVVGNDILDGHGKRIDALLKTKGNISKFLFTEIKTHKPGSLISSSEYRPGVYSPEKELIGAISQIQKTIHKVTLKLQNNFIRPEASGGDPTGEEILFVKPRGIVVVGVLDDFKTDNGINYEKLSSFELFRQQVNGIEIITFDELYQRVKFIVEENEA